MVFCHGVDHAPGNKRETRLSFFFFCSRDMIDKAVRKNTKAAITCLKKKTEKEASLTFVCTCGSKMRLKFQIETRKIERGIAVIPLVLITTCFMCRNRFLVISRDGSRIGQCK